MNLVQPSLVTTPKRLGCTIALQNRKAPEMTNETLINIAEYYKRSGVPVPVDIQARLLERGIDVKKYQQV